MYVEQLKELSKKNALVEGSYIISKIEAKPFKAKEGFFLQCELSDKTGSIKGVVWDKADILKECLKNKHVFTITGESTRYNDNPQVVIKTAVKMDNYNPSDFMPSLSQEDIEKYVNYLHVVEREIQDPTCKKIWSYLIKTPEKEISEKFRTCPGGVGDNIHHSYLGGLLEHTVSMIKIAEHFCQSRPELNRDILLTGCLVHDIGKIMAYNWSVIIEMTDAGRLLHHTTLGISLLNIILNDSLGKIDETVSLHLAHIIVSHHQDEGIRKPMTAESEAVAQIDSLDASIKSIQQYIENPDSRQGEENWTKYFHLTERQYYLGKNPVKEIPLPSNKIVPKIIEEKLF